MFEGKTIVEIINMGGFTMYILLFCSVLSLGVMLAKLASYRRKSRTGRVEFMASIKSEIEKGAVARAIALCEASASPSAAVVRAGLKKHGHEEKIISNAMEREIMLETVKLEEYTSIIGTIGNTAVYIGLFGTVLGIVRAFHNISTIGTGGISVVIGGVSEALICTATGLMVAIPAVIGYNYFMKRVDTFVTEMEYCASETTDLLTTGKP
ncbi:MAG: hypothetical protein A2219_07580 [Elusimicrobia bacterium RIFOXYA2_FULL_50_26]|nr:MAG: hypothetical protein A2219_07580 [Elusimicrobia bacterium RIFOXYA2_FULL_50_26]